MADENPTTEVVADAQVEGADAQGEPQAPDEVGVLKKVLSGIKRQLSRKEKREAEQALALKAAAKKIAQLEGHLTGTQKKDAEANLRALRKAAAESQDWDKFEEYDSKLAEVRRIPVQAKEIPVPDVIADEMDSEDRDAFETFASEKDNSGKPKRPWASEGHEMYDEAVDIGRSVFRSKKFADAPIEDKLAEIDRRMAVLTGKAVHSTAAVLSGAAGASGKTKAGPKLSDEEKKIAHRFFSHMAPDEAEKTWAAAKAKSAGKKNAYFGATGNV